MARLIETDAFGDALPIVIGAARLEAAPAAPMHAILPFRGQEGALSDALRAAHGVGWPQPGRSEARGEVRIVWAGLDQSFLIGTVPDARLGQHAAIIDQSDAWASVLISGTDAREVLARLCPLDLSPQIFKRGHSARSLLGHMQASIQREGADRYRLMVFRSMAGTLLHELQEAMTGVAARARRP